MGKGANRTFRRGGRIGAFRLGLSLDENTDESRSWSAMKAPMLPLEDNETMLASDEEVESVDDDVDEASEITEVESQERIPQPRLVLLALQP